MRVDKNLLAKHAVEVGQIEARVAKFDALNNTLIEGARTFTMAEYSREEILISRNYQGVKACRAILRLNSEVKRETGEPFLRRMYDISQVRFAQRDVREMEDLMEDFAEMIFSSLQSDNARQFA